MYNRIRTYVTCAISAILLAACAPSKESIESKPEYDAGSRTHTERKMNSGPYIRSLDYNWYLEHLKNQFKFRSRSEPLAFQLAASKRAEEKISDVTKFNPLLEERVAEDAKKRLNNSK